MRRNAHETNSSASTRLSRSSWSPECRNTPGSFFFTLFRVRVLFVPFCMHGEIPPSLAALDIEFNLPRNIGPMEVRKIRENAVEEVRRVMDLYSSGEPPFGKPIIEERPEEVPRRKLLEEQFAVSELFLDQAVEEDTIICGHEESGKRGLVLPILQVRKKGKQ